MISENLPVHFFTIVLNGMPFITYHLDVFRDLPFRWHWHIVEGVAALVHDTAWSLGSGGHIASEMHDHGRSNDGTSTYLDRIAAEFPDQVTLYRKGPDIFWDGKREMVSAPLANVRESCLLWQVDADELWLPGQIETVRRLFQEQPHRTAAFYWCDYFVGPNAVISTRHNYAQNPKQEWLRTWRFTPGARWKAHEPPTLVIRADDGREVDLGRAMPFYHDELEAAGVRFQHFAYATEAQVKFKEDYYGYAGAVEKWRLLQTRAKTSVFLRDYFPWVNDATMVDSAARCGVMPLAELNERGTWRFLRPDRRPQVHPITGRSSRQIVIDGIFFQLAQSGVARVWRSLLTEWSRSGFADQILVLDRHGTAPRISGIRYRSIPEYAYDRSARDSLALQKVCDEFGADLFISTYYTTPTTTPALMLVYDMIAEVSGANLQKPVWQEKHLCIRHASRYVAISESTRRDLLRFFPDIEPSRIEVMYCGVDPIFAPSTRSEVEQFRRKFGVDRPYFLLVGERIGPGGFKNAILLFKAFAGFEDADDYAIFCAGGPRELEPELRALAPRTKVICARLSDDELRLAYAGAVALVYPSRHEGFGMPLAEAMAVGCPVITCRNSSLVEVAADAGCYVDDSDPADLRGKLVDIRRPEMRNQLVSLGMQRVRQFNWTVAASRLESLIGEAILQLRNDQRYMPAPTWNTFRAIQDAMQHDTQSLLARIGLLESKLSKKDQAGVSGADVLASVPGYNYVAELKRELVETREVLADMQRSPFWKLRRQTLAAMQRLGFIRRHA